MPFLLGKSLVAKVENRRTLGTHNLKNGKTVPRLVLFDTSSEDVDINLNQKLIELLVSQDSQSKLPLPGAEEIGVFVSFIDKDGDIYVQKESSTFTMIEKLIVEHGEKAMKSPPTSNLQVGHLYLVKYSEDGSLYRAEVLAEQDPNVKDKVRVFFVDYGNTSTVAKSDVWELSTISEVVQDLPRQALRCRLDGAPPPGHYWSEQATKALRELVPESQLVMLKVTAGPTDCPLVEIHLPNSKDGSINFDLSTELDLFPLSPSSQPVSPVRNGDSNGDRVISPTPAKGKTVGYSLSPGPEQQIPQALAHDLASLKTLLAPTIPPEGQYFDINVTFAVSPSSFVVQPYNEGHKLELLMTELNAYYNEESNCREMNIQDVCEGKYFAARHTDGFWYRVRVANVIDKENFAVRYVDYGDLTMVSLTDLQPLWGQFRNLPYQAINAKLADVVPIEGDWKPEDTVWFNNRVSDKQFVSVVKAVMGTAVEPVVVLSLVDTSHPSEDKFIAQELIQGGRGLPPRPQ